MSKHAPKDPPDPVEEYRDWVDHRYSPGYFVGGHLPPHLKRLRDASPPSGRVFGAMLLLFGALTLYFALRSPAISIGMQVRVWIAVGIGVVAMLFGVRSLWRSRSST